MLNNLKLLDSISVGDLIVLFTGLSALVGFFRWKILPVFRRTGHFLDDWFGEDARPGQPRRLGIPERLQRLEERKDEEHQAIRENQVNLENRLDELNTKFESHVTQVEASRQAGHQEAIEMWKAVAKINSPEDFDVFLDRYARKRLKNGDTEPANSSSDE